MEPLEGSLLQDDRDAASTLSIERFSQDAFSAHHLQDDDALKYQRGTRKPLNFESPSVCHERESYLSARQHRKWVRQSIAE